MIEKTGPTIYKGESIYNTGAGGVSMVGGDRKTLTPGHSCAENNHVHHYSRRARNRRPCCPSRAATVRFSPAYFERRRAENAIASRLRVRGGGNWW